MQVNALIQWLVSAGGGATRAAAAASKCRKRAFNWTSRERFPSASTVGADLGEQHVAQRSRGFADTEEVISAASIATSKCAGESSQKRSLARHCPAPEGTTRQRVHNPCSKSR